MAVEKYTALQQITLTSTASSVTFGSIPSGYRDLRLVVAGAVNTNQPAYVYLNNDTTASNYTRVEMGGDGSTPFYGNAATAAYMTFTTGQCVNTLDLFDYSQTNKHKSLLTRSSYTTGVLANAGRWANTAAVTTIKLQAQVGTFNSGTTFKLFGVK